MGRLTFSTIVLLATSVSAEPVAINHHLSVEEVDAVTGEPVARPSGFIEPGQGALIRLSVSFTPDVGTMWHSPHGYSARVLAFSDSRLHLWAFGGASDGTWHSLELAPSFGAQAGTPTGRVSGIGPWQEPGGANQGNPIENVWQGVWVPADYTSRTLTFRTDAWSHPSSSSNLWMEESGVPGAYILVTGSTEVDFLEVKISDVSICYPNCDGSTIEPKLTVNDLTCFINEFAQAQTLPHEQQVTHYANCDGSTEAPVLTVNDFTCFIDEFAQGCP